MNKKHEIALKSEIDLMGTEDLIEVLRRRWEAKECAYAIVYGTDNLEEFEIVYALSPEQVVDVTEVLLEDAGTVIEEGGESWFEDEGEGPIDEDL